MSQSGAVPSVHSRRHRPEMNQNNANETPITAAVARFGETEWEARDVCRNFFACLCCKWIAIYLINYHFNFYVHSHKDNVNLKRPERVLHKWKKP